MLSRKYRKPILRNAGPCCRCESLENRQLLTAFVNFSVVVNGGASNGASTLQVTAGEVVNYKIMAEMAPVGTSINLGGITQTISSLKPGVDGLGSAEFNLQESASAPVQANFTAAPTLQSGFNGAFSNPGVLTARASTGNFDIDTVTAFQPIGTFVGVSSANTPSLLEVATGSFTVKSLGNGGASVVGMNINPPVTAAGALHINDGQSLVVTASQSSPLFSFAGLTLTTAVRNTTPPTAKLAASNLTTAGQSTYTFNVTYTGANAINVSTLGTGDIHVIGPNSFSQLATFVSATSTSNTSPVTATYKLTAPSSTWLPTTNGTYSAWMETGQVTDITGLPVAAGELGTFNVSVPTTVKTPPTAKLSASNLTTAGQSTYTFTVTYTGAAAINVSTLGTGDIHVIGPNSFSQLATFVSATSTSNTSPVTATYKLTAPSSTWVPANNGTYSAWMETGQVADINGLPVAAGELGTFNVSVPTTVTTPPTAKLTASTLTTTGQTTYTFTVTYTGAAAINISTLGNGNLHVYGSNGALETLTFVSASSATNTSPLTATYRITAPSGTWTSSNNGTFSVWMESRQVADVNGNFVAAVELGTFTMDIPA